MDRYRRSHRLKLSDQRKSVGDPCDVCACCDRNCKSQSTVRMGNPFLTVLVRAPLSSTSIRKLIPGAAGDATESRAEQYSVPVQNDLAKKHPSQCAECQVRPKRQ